MNIKKIGLTALAGSMVGLSAVAGELTVTGAMNITHSSYSGSVDSAGVASGIGIENAVFATGSTELDNGFVVSLTQGINFSDSTYLSVDMGDLGSLSYVQTDAGGGLEALDDMTPSAYEEVNDGAAGTVAEFSTTSGFAYSNTLGGATVGLTYSDGGSTAAIVDGKVDTGTSTGSDASIGITLPVADTGLTVFGGAGYEGQTDGKELDHTTIGAKYAFGPVSVGYQVNNEDDSDSSGTDLESKLYSIAFNVNENMAISYGVIDTDNGSGIDQEHDGFSASYTMGALALKAYQQEADNSGHVSGATSKKTEISLSVAF